MGLATDGRILLQVQGRLLQAWNAEGDDLHPLGQAPDLLDEAPLADAWLSLAGAVATYLRQLQAPVPGEPQRSRAFLRLSLLLVSDRGVSTAGAGLDLAGRLTDQARSGDRLFLAVDDPEGRDFALLSLDVSRWEAPRLIDRQALPARAEQLLVLPETGQLLALASGDKGIALWSWDLTSSAPQARPATPLPLGGEPMALLRIPEGLLAVNRAAAGLVIPLRGSRQRLDRARPITFPVEAATGPGSRRFVDVDAAAWVTDQVCLYHGIHVSTHAALRSANNLLACFDLPAGGVPTLRQVLAADPVIDVSFWQPAVHLAVLGDRLLLARGSLGGIEVFKVGGDGGGARVQTVDPRLPGRVTALLRQGDRLFSAEGDAQLRSWQLDAQGFGGLRAEERLALPAAGKLISRDLPAGRGSAESIRTSSRPDQAARWERSEAAGAPPPDLVLWREAGIATVGNLQRVRLGAGPRFTPLPAETHRDLDPGLRAAGDLLWSRQDGRIWRFDEGGRQPLVLPELRGSLQDVALLGEHRLLAAGSDGLLVLDASLQVVGRLALPGPATAIAVDSELAEATVWVASGELRTTSPEPRGATALHCIDLGQPAQPRLRASIDLPGDRVDRLRAAGGGTAGGTRVVGSGWQRRSAGGFAYDDPLLFLVDARTCDAPRLEAVSRWDRPPAFLRQPYAEARLDWDLGPDGQRLFAAEGGVAVYGWTQGPSQASRAGAYLATDPARGSR